MERLTKETQLGPFAALKDEAEAVPGAFGSYDCLYAHMLAVTRLKQYEDTGLIPEEVKALIPPPNDPLTLEQLREMDGEPVWISPVNANGKIPARWMLVNGYNPNKDIYLFAPSCNITQGYNGKSYGKVWLAYPRKPEERLGFGSVEIAGRT